MIKNITLIITLLFFGLLITDVLNNRALTNGSGAPAGKTGSPGDVATCTQCHGGTAISQPGLITSNIPTGGYISGNTYTITAVIGHTTFNKFGFQLSPQSSSGALLGAMVVTNTTETQLVGSGKYITHTSAGTAGSNNTKTWTFDWIAPGPGTGAVTFYGAFNAANNDLNSTGDQIFTSTMTVQQDINSSVTELNKTEGILSIFPNPVEDQLSISLNATSINSESNLEIISIEGRLIRKVILKNSLTGNSLQKIDVDMSDLNPGIYFISLRTKGHNYIEKVIKK